MNCKQCINKNFAETDNCKNFAESKAKNSCLNFLSLSSFHKKLIEATCPECQDKVASKLKQQRKEIKKTGHTQSEDPDLEEIVKNLKLR